MPKKKASATSLADFKPRSGGSPDSPSNPKKKRRSSNTPSSTQGPPSTPPSNDLVPPPLTGYGDTIVASNPFDDMPPAGSTPGNMNPGMGQHPMPPMNMPYMKGMSMGMGPHHMGNHMGGPMGGPMGPMTGPMGPNGPMGPSGPMGPNGPMTGPMGHSGPMNRNMNGPMGGPMSGPMSNPMNNPMNGPMNMNGMNMNCPMSMNSNMGNGGPGMPMTSMSSVNNMSGMNGPMNSMSCSMGGPGMPNGPGMQNGPNMGPKPLPVNSGKVYPPDKPMVFNPQNPNAPPIYPCGLCHKEVHDNDQAILCESGCNFFFHRACSGLTECAYHHVSTEVYGEWVCDKCLNSKNIPLVKFKP